MKRTIELRTHMSAGGYSVHLKINGQEFGECSRSAGTALAVVQSIYRQLKTVYGRELFMRYVEYQDILAAMKAVAQIVKSMDVLYRQILREENNV